MPTRREELRDLLSDHWLAPRDISKTLGIPIRDAHDDLQHLQHSLKKNLKMRPASCDACDFSFKKRRRISAPSRCPECRSERISGPWFHVGG